jgi:hypothetical protein
MAHALPLYVMMPVAQLSRMVLAEGPLHDTEIAQRIKDATEAAPCPRDAATSEKSLFHLPNTRIPPRCGQMWTLLNL